MKLNQFLKKCYDKQIVRSLTIFVVSCWTVIQVSQVTHEAVGLPQEFVSTLIILFFIVMPFYIYRTWNRFGKEEDLAQLTEAEQQESSAFKSMYMKGLGLASILCISVIVLVANNKFFSKKDQFVIEKQRNTDKIAVLNFKNNTGKDENEVIGEMASDWISHGIVKEKVSQVISSDVINSYSGIVKANHINMPQSAFLRKYLNPGQIINGSYFLNKDELVFQVSLLDGENDNLLFSFEDETCPADSPLECIEKIKQVILSYYITAGNDQNNIEDYPPKFEAYKLMLKAKQLNDPTSDRYIEYLNAALAIDSNYFEPKASRIGYYYNVGNYQEAKEQVDKIESFSLETERQKNIVEVYESLMKGDNKGAFENMQKEFDLSPLEFENNTTMMIMALQFVNNPEIVESISSQINQDLMDATDCEICSGRVKLLMDSFLALKQPQKVVTTFRAYPNLQSEYNIFFPLSTAYIRLEKKDLLTDLLQKAQQSFSEEQLETFSLHLYNQSQLFDFELEFEDLTSSKNLEIISNFNQKKYKTIINEINEQDEASLHIYKAAAYFKIGQTAKAKQEIDDLFSKKGDLDFGFIDYQLAKYYALIGQEDEMYKALQSSITEGYYFTDSSYMNDSVFKNYIDENQFQELLNYWN